MPRAVSWWAYTTRTSTSRCGLGGEYWKYKTYLAYDFAKADKGQYALYLIFNSGGIWDNTSHYGDAHYGPSSGHPQVVNHLFGDGSVHSLLKDIDVATYMFLITKNGHDPYALGQIGEM